MSGMAFDQAGTKTPKPSPATPTDPNLTRRFQAAFGSGYIPVATRSRASSAMVRVSVPQWNRCWLAETQHKVGSRDR